MNKTKNTYTYIGEVGYMNQIYSNHWEGTTIAESEKKALSNLAFRFKKEHGMVATARVALYPKNLVLVSDF